MTQTVNYNGTIHNFPDEATPAMISQALGLNGVSSTHSLTPAESYQNEYPVLRTAGRTGRNIASGLSSLTDLALLVPKTAALGAGLGAEALGAEKLGGALQRFGMTPTMADTSKAMIDNVTGGRLQPINNIEKGADFVSEVIASSAPFIKGPQAATNITKDQGPKALNALKGVLNPADEFAARMPSAAKSPILPLPKVTEDGKKIAQLAKKYDIPIGMDDITNSKFYKTMISEGQSVPFSGSSRRIEKQLGNFTKAVSKSIGLDTDKLTVEAIDEAFTKVGKEFDDLTKGQTFTMNDDVAQGLNDILEVAESGGYGADGVNLYNKYIKDLGAVVDKDGVVKGETLAKLRAKLNAVARKATDANAKGLASELENTISDFITDGSPEALKQAKYRYKNLITIEPLASKDQIGGQISPAQLLNRVRQVYKRQFSRGQAGELGDLANIGQYIKETIPNSGTAQRTGARNILTGNLGVAPFLTMANPAAGLVQGAASVAGMVGNKALQSRNFDQELLDIAAGNVASRPLLSAPSALAAIAGTNTAGQKLLPAPQSHLVEFSKKFK